VVKLLSEISFELAVNTKINNMQSMKKSTQSKQRLVNLSLGMAISLSFLFMSNSLFAGKGKDDDKKNDTIKSNHVSGLKFRSIGPAFTSGRIADFAVNPKNHSEYYVAVASGHIWKTVNNGTTFEPVFDNYGAYAIGCLKMDPKNPNVVWAGHRRK
jgi:hypothetical protein